MAVAPSYEIDVDVARALVRERLEEFLHERERKILVDEQHLAIDRRIEDQEWPAGEIDDHACQRFIERHVGGTEAADAALVGEGNGEGFAEDETGVFDGVVIVDERIARGDDLEI